MHDALPLQKELYLTNTITITITSSGASCLQMSDEHILQEIHEVIDLSMVHEGR